MGLKTPVIFIVFNRKDVTERVFAEIRKQRPERLYIAADGPRGHVSEDVEKCRAARAVVEEVDWPCEVVRDYSEENMGCMKKISSAITKAFEIYDEAIILEDDCLPHKEFFSYCEAMLKKYRNATQVMHISGHYWREFDYRGKDSFYFSTFPRVWGWATWKRAWELYDKKSGKGNDYFKKYGELGNNAGAYFCEKRYRDFLNEGSMMWDFRWAMSVLDAGGVCVTPVGNYIKNIGDYDGAHVGADNKSLHAEYVVQDGECVYPKAIVLNAEADMHAMEDIFVPAPKLSFFRKLVNSSKKRIRRLKSVLGN